MSDKDVSEHVQKHTITEYLHTPEHDERSETLMFRNSKHQLEDVEHLGCYKCGTMEDRESHHIIERSWANKVNLDKVAWLLYHFRDYHGHCKRDFKSDKGLAKYLKSLGNKELALDSIYNQLILCELHHRGDLGIHGTSSPTWDASFVMEDGFLNVLTEEQYEKMQQELEDDHDERFKK
jgi:hypothetical protein